jgi:cytochrome b
MPRVHANERVPCVPSSPRLARVQVWDRFVRLFHWALVASVIGLVVTAHLGQQEIHMSLGTGLLMLVVARLWWGFFGAEHARFANFVTSPLGMLRYLGEIAHGHPRRYLGHNPAGGWMVLALLAVLLGLLLTGVALQATLEFEGPLVDVLRGVGDQQVHLLMEVHDYTLTALYLLVPLHLLGVLLATLQHKENLVKAMITGEKPLTTGR